MERAERTRLSVALALSLGVLLAALAAPAGAAKGGQPDRASPADEKSLEIWAYFDGDTPVSGGEVRAYADGRRLRERGDGPGPVTTFSGGEALLRFDSLPSALRIVVSGGRAGGERVDGSLRTKVRGVSDGDLVHVNPVTTVSDLLAHREDGPGLDHPRDLTERTLGIEPALDDHDLYATDRWFDGDRFLRWALERGSVGAGARALVRLIERPGFDRRQFDPPDGGGPEAGVAAGGGSSAGKALNGLLAATKPCPGASDAKDVIGGLTDAAVGAASLTGPEGFAAGYVATVFKKLIDLGLGACVVKAPAEFDIETALRGLSEQVSKLNNQFGTKFLQQQIAETKKRVVAIKTTQEGFLAMVKWARDRENVATDRENLKTECKLHPELKKCEKKALTSELEELEKNLEELRLGLIERTRNFLTDADKRRQDVAQLDQALRVVQTGKDDEENTFERPPLIPAVREELGKHFWTNESSQRLQGFFDYYDWVQSQLATLLTEYYLLGGSCAVNFVNSSSHSNDLLTSNDCAPRKLVAEEDVKQIQKNIAAQRATLPPRVLDSRVFIDRNTKRMWLTDLTTRSPREMVSRGLVFEEDGPGLYDPARYSLYGNNYYFDIDSYLGWGFQSFPGWRIPTAHDYSELFGGVPGQPSQAPRDRLDSLGVRQNNGPIRWPYFWIADDFHGVRNGGRLSLRGLNRVEADVFYLLPGAPSVTNRVKVGTGCNWDSRTVGSTTVWTPQCSGSWDTGSWNTNFSAHILWSRGPMTVDQGAAYWCNPSKPPSWDPAKC